MVLCNDAFDAHVDDCDDCLSLDGDRDCDYCPIGMSLQESWIEAMYDSSEEPHCAPGEALMSALLEEERPI